jgi:hypothetical protein
MMSTLVVHPVGVLQRPGEDALHRLVAVEAMDERNEGSPAAEHILLVLALAMATKF